VLGRLLADAGDSTRRSQRRRGRKGRKIRNGFESARRQRTERGRSTNPARSIPRPLRLCDLRRLYVNSHYSPPNPLQSRNPRNHRGCPARYTARPCPAPPAWKSCRTPCSRPSPESCIRKPCCDATTARCVNWRGWNALCTCGARRRARTGDPYRAWRTFPRPSAVRPEDRLVLRSARQPRLAFPHFEGHEGAGPVQLRGRLGRAGGAGRRRGGHLRGCIRRDPGSRGTESGDVKGRAAHCVFLLPAHGGGLPGGAAPWRRRHVGRNLQNLARGGQAQDHPIHPAMPETAYLKAVLCRTM
jgi:hypothetical protein